MDRWWSDAERAVQIMGSVDSSDVVQGVASAVLGLHALNAAALQPLAGTTLVDRQTVRGRLGSVDTRPVAETVAKATRPVLGDAAPVYGAMVARSWQEDAMDAADLVLTRWTTQGMPWPTAVQRFASVVGLPAQALGSALTSLQAPAIPELVVKDMGDRVLLKHAAAVGRREGDGAVSKMTASQAEFEREHPRDRLGRFADKPDGVETSRERRLRMKDKVRSIRSIRSQRQSRQRANAPAVQREEVSWGLLGLLPGKPAAQAEPRQERATGRGAQSRGAQRRGRQGVEAQASAEADPYAVQPAFDEEFAVTLDQESYVILSELDAVSLVAGTANGLFNGAGLRELVGLSPMALDAAHVQGEIDMLARMMPDQEFVVLRLNGVAAVDDTNYSVALADAGEYRINMGFAEMDPGSPSLGMEFDSGFYMPSNANPARAVSQGRPIRVINADLTNGDLFPTQTRNLPYDRFGNLEKALSGYELQEFNRLRNRDEEGKFAPKQSAGSAPNDLADMRARRERRKALVRDRRRRIRDQRLAAVAPVTIAEQPLQTASQRAEPTQRATERREPHRGRLYRASDRRGRQGLRRQVRNELATQGGEKQQRFDFARARGWVMSNQALADLAGLDVENNWVGSDDGEGVRAPDLAEDVPVVAGTEALRKLATAWRKGVEIRSTVPVDGGPFERELDAQLVAEDYIATLDMADYEEDVVPRGFAEARSVGDDEVVWYPRVALTHDRSLSEPVVIFGSDSAMKSMTQPGSDIDPNRLTLIYSGTFDGLLNLRASDESLSALPENEPRSNGFVRAFWYQDEG